MFLAECFIKDIIVGIYVKSFTNISTIVRFPRGFNFLYNVQIFTSKIFYKQIGENI